jgi:glucosyl-dolichyl phosphate glucuronosyltransferase
MKTSIIIATHARPAALARLLDSLAPQIIGGRHELIVAENGTPIPTPLDHPFPLVHLHQAEAGKCAIQNRALTRAAGELLAFLDDDLTVSPGYVSAVEQFFDSHPEFAAMKGRIAPAEDPEAKAGALAPYLDLPLVEHGDAVIEVRGVLGANMAFRAAALREVGPFDERLGPGAAGHEEETEMSRRLRRAGYRLGYAPAALVYHEVDPARASRQRFIRVARERGYCRTLHETHTTSAALLAIVVARVRLLAATMLRCPSPRLAREERRLAVARGILDGVRAHHAATTTRPSTAQASPHSPAR